jgi:hypothetical protein
MTLNLSLATRPVDEIAGVAELPPNSRDNNDMMAEYENGRYHRRNRLSQISRAKAGLDGGH